MQQENAPIERPIPGLHSHTLARTPRVEKTKSSKSTGKKTPGGAGAHYSKGLYSTVLYWLLFCTVENFSRVATVDPSLVSAHSLTTTELASGAQFEVLSFVSD